MRPGRLTARPGKSGPATGLPAVLVGGFRPERPINGSSPPADGQRSKMVLHRLMMKYPTTSRLMTCHLARTKRPKSKLTASYSQVSSGIFVKECRSMHKRTLMQKRRRGRFYGKRRAPMTLSSTCKVWIVSLPLRLKT